MNSELLLLGGWHQFPLKRSAESGKEQSPGELAVAPKAAAGVGLGVLAALPRTAQRRRGRLTCPSEEASVAFDITPTA